METLWVKNRSSRFFPEISVIGQLKIAEAESWHEESTGGADLLSVRRNAGIGRVKLPEIPTGAKTGKIAITTPGGIAVSKDIFTVTP